MTSKVWCPSLPWKERLVFFLPVFWCHPVLRTCIWSSAAGRPADMHFICQWKETLLDHLPSDITLKSGWGTSVHCKQCLKAQQVFHIFKSCYITKLICLHIMVLADLQTFFSLLPIYMVIFKNTVITTLLLSDSAYFSRVSQNVLC